MKSVSSKRFDTKHCHTLTIRLQFLGQNFSFYHHTETGPWCPLIYLCNWEFFSKEHVHMPACEHMHVKKLMCENDYFHPTNNEVQNNDYCFL